ncbi:MAG TPA: type II toxin-antitoxin system RelE/ParE family toxin [Longimicrobiaceae bacterium]|nr:type II toxin-antitoxin system RelE/ParE family toxin [Longimicrobiaceae bacterium]
MPADVQDVFGSSLLDAQYGDTPYGARAFGEGLPSQIMKIAEDFERDTYRAAYTAAFPECVYVLHVFKKKSKSGIATPRADKELILARFKRARAHYEEHYVKARRAE